MALDAEQRDLIAISAAADRQGIRNRVKRLVIGFDLYAAVMFLTGSPRRWLGNAYQPAQQLTGWIPVEWRFRVQGLLLIGLTLGILYANHCRMTWLYYVMSWLILTFYIWWTLMFTYAALTDPRAGLLAPGVFGFVAAMHALLVTTSKT
jgi:hypothetical protein